MHHCYEGLQIRMHLLQLAKSLLFGQEDLFARVKTLLDALVAEPGAAHAATLRTLCGTLEAAHINLNQHLQKEEEQLLPLLRANFSVLEQTKMFWQLLCSIPVAQVSECSAPVSRTPDCVTFAGCAALRVSPFKPFFGFGKPPTRKQTQGGSKIGS